MSIKIMNPGILSTIQDQGRFEGMDLGFSQSGAMDTFAYNLANQLVGNPVNNPVIETVGGVFRFQAESKGTFSITGAEVRAYLNGIEIRLWESYFMKAGDIVELSGATYGLRNYFAFSGEWLNVSTFMNSCATDLKAGVGGLGKGRLVVGDVIEIAWDQEDLIKRSLKVRSNYFKQLESVVKRVRVMLGPQEDAFPETAINLFFENTYMVDSNSDRMGIRLIGPKINHKDKADILSDSIPFGAIQISGDGMPIVMMADRQTTGGYAKIATVISADLPIMAQLKPGDSLQFAKTHFSEEETWWSEVTIQEKRIKSTNRLNLLVNKNPYKVLIEELIP